MSLRNNRKCIVCGTSYRYCSSCLESITKPAWYAIFHDQNCHDIYNAVTAVYSEQGKDEAKKILDTCNLAGKEHFHPNIIRLINEIYDIKEEANEAVEPEKTENIKVEKVEEQKEVKEETKVEKVEIKEDVKEEVKTEEVKEFTSTTSTDVTKNFAQKNFKNKK